MHSNSGTELLVAKSELLPEPGPTRLSKDTVRQAHRFRLLKAMASAVARIGLANTSVADVVKEAKVSRRTFYELYKNKDDCFLDLIKFGSDALLIQFQSASDNGQLNEITLSKIIKNYLNLLQSEPNFAKCILIESFAAGQPAIDLRYEITTKIAQLMSTMHKSALERNPDSIKPNPDIELITYAISSLVTKLVANDEFDQLTNSYDRIMYFIDANIKL